MKASEVPRSVQIADEIRAKILSGVLAIGARVPSTREITRQTGVAMATATKALAILKDEGLVSSVPGVGTVVAGSSHELASSAGSVVPGAGVSLGAPRGEAKSSGAAHSARNRQWRAGAATPTVQSIVDVAITIADAEGLAGVSMRRIASELGMSTMSLYHHVANKGELLAGMMDLVLLRQSFPADMPSPWRERLEIVVRELWGTFREHRWLAPALSITRPRAQIGGLDYTERVLSTLSDIGLEPAEIFTTHLALFNCVRGTALGLDLETEDEAETGLDSRQWMAAHEPEIQAVVSQGRYPTFERLDALAYDLDFDTLFEFTLQRFLDGVAAMIGDIP